MVSFKEIFGGIMKNNMGMGNLTDEFFALSLKQFFDENKKGILIVTPTLFEANKLFNNIANYLDNTYLFPMDDILMRKAIDVSPEYLLKRLEVLNKLIIDDKQIVVTHLEGYLKYLPHPSIYKCEKIELKEGLKVKIDDLIKKLFDVGYKRETIISKTGEIGVRGFVLDIFPVMENNPVRIEFFGDEIESIRYFDINTQKSINKIDQIIINPFLDLTDDTIDYASIKDYFIDGYVIYKDYTQIKLAYQKNLYDVYDATLKDIDIAKDMFDLDELYEKDAIHYLSFDSEIVGYNIRINNIGARPIDNFGENFELLTSFVDKSIKNNKTVIIALSERVIANLKKYLDINYTVTSVNNIYENRVNVINLPLINGFSYDNYIFISENDIFKSKREYPNKVNSIYRHATKIQSISKLEIGDYVVHNLYGIGVYNGIKTLTKNGLRKDYIEILYLKNDKLYIPVEKISYIGKYAGKDGNVPKISSLSGSDWKKTKNRIKENLELISKEIILMQAKRKMLQGFKFSQDNNMQLLFEKEFKYQLTLDQAKVIDEIKRDMESIIPMDRLLCGDVGYGKTEVAFRAMFKAVLDSKQVLYLCPTTILSKQIYDIAIDRFKNFPVKIGLLNRFVSNREASRVLEGLKNGEYDIVIGTHRILSDDIKPKNLGLLVIDEEQRFGVVHKEKIKKYKENVDILTLSATPIPRTLQMATVGLKDLSIINTAPANRQPVQTYVIEENDYIIKNVVYKEVGRGGQVFILNNRIANIDELYNKLNKLLPDIKIIYAHGQMSSNELEDRVYKFINKEYDVLLCTTIIENGVDIPNANSLIVLDADRLGLSQLYQLRGRVGRSDRLAYAYLMYNKDKALTDTAIKRLKVIKDYTELGSGFGIASKDLAIRGAGDILGSEQAGFIEAVGIELYFKLLNIEVAKLKGEVIEDIEEDYKPPLYSVETHIEDKYVDDDDLKIEIHKKINEIDSYDKLVDIRNELEDRFGKVSSTMEKYMHEEWFEKMANKLQIINVDQKPDYVELVFSKEKSLEIDYQYLFARSINISKNFNFKYKKDIFYLKLFTRDLEKDPIYYLNELLKEM